MDMMDFCRLKPYKSLMQNSLWHYDAYPELPELQPNGRLEIGKFNGPGVVRTVHLTLNMVGSSNREELLRGVFLVVQYDGHNFDSIHVPVGDFFCDSFAGESIPYTSIVMSKRPTNSLFCYISMPFKKEIVLSLVNTTDKRVEGYGYVTAETLPEWETNMGYFHARWFDGNIHIPNGTVPLLSTNGHGHFFGCHLTAISSCPHFQNGASGICEGNDEFYIDGAVEPVCNYLGTEDFFGFSWNWRKLWYDNYSGTTYLNNEGGEMRLACYRFLLNDPIRFDKSLKFQINYQYEINNKPLRKASEENNGYVKFGIVTYWFQSEPVDANN
ncbi:MAG: DUF2961 domain-containing protein [Lentisphaerota bacterium]